MVRGGIVVGRLGSRVEGGGERREVLGAGGRRGRVVVMGRAMGRVLGEGRVVVVVVVGGGRGGRGQRARGARCLLRGWRWPLVSWLPWLHSVSREALAPVVLNRALVAEHQGARRGNWAHAGCRLLHALGQAGAVPGRASSSSGGGGGGGGSHASQRVERQASARRGAAMEAVDAHATTLGCDGGAARRRNGTPAGPGDRCRCRSRWWGGELLPRSSCSVSSPAWLLVDGRGCTCANK